MSSGDDRDAYIRQLRAEGWTAIEIGAEVGLSRSQVHRILAVVGDAARGDLDDEDDEPDPWTDDGTEARLALMDAESPDEEDPFMEPFTYCGEDPPGNPRYLDGNGLPMNALDFWRWRVYRRDGGDDDDRERAKRGGRHGPPDCRVRGPGAGQWWVGTAGLLPGGCREHTVSTI